MMLKNFVVDMGSVVGTEITFILCDYHIYYLQGKVVYFLHGRFHFSFNNL